MSAAEEVSWKLARCETCGVYLMMPEVNNICLQCERESRHTNFSDEDIRWIVAYRGPEDFIRAAWRLATETTNAAFGINTKTGAMTAHRWPAGENLPIEETEDAIILAVCPASRKAELPSLLVTGSEGMLSDEDAGELAAEVVVRASLGDGGVRFWEAVDEQLRERTELHRSGARRGN